LVHDPENRDVFRRLGVDATVSVTDLVVAQVIGHADPVGLPGRSADLLDAAS